MPVPSGLVAWWPGNGNANHLRGGRHGSAVGTVTFPAGMVGQAFGFNRSGFVQVADDPVWTLGQASFSIELWANFTTIAGRDAFMGHDEGGGETNKWIFWFDVAGHTTPGGPALRFHTNDRFDTNPRVGPIDPVAAPWQPVLGSWYHVAVTRSSNVWTLYIDGSAVASSVDGNPVQDPSAPLTIGDAEGFMFDGSIDEVGIYDRALSAGEVGAIASAGAAGKGGYSVGGFLPPVDNPLVINTASAGSAVPVRFSLGADFGLNIMAPGYPKSGTVPCGADATDEIEETSTAGQSSLSYDPGSGRYVYVWKSEQAWKGTCRQSSCASWTGRSSAPTSGFVRRRLPAARLERPCERDGSR